MSSLVISVLSFAAAAWLLWMVAWQWRSGKFIDPIFSAFSDEFTARPLLWCTTAIYGFIAMMCVILGFHFLTHS